MIMSRYSIRALKMQADRAFNTTARPIAIRVPGHMRNEIYFIDCIKGIQNSTYKVSIRKIKQNNKKSKLNTYKINGHERKRETGIVQWLFFKYLMWDLT